MILVVDSFRESCSALAQRLQERLSQPTLCATSAVEAMTYIKIGYVRIYLARLRQAYDEARPKVGVPYPGKDVFWTGRVNGEYGHQIRANVYFS